MREKDSGKNLEVDEVKMWSFSLGVTRMDVIRNDYIRGTVRVLEIKPERPFFISTLFPMFRAHDFCSKI